MSDFHETNMNVVDLFEERERGELYTHEKSVCVCVCGWVCVCVRERESEREREREIEIVRECSELICQHVLSI